MFYGQFKTDKFISQIFDDCYLGTAIDVGAARAIRNNNTYFFEQKGWTVYCIEPNKKHLPDLISHRKHVLNFACGSQNTDDVDFTICTLQNGNQDAVSALEIDKLLLEKHLEYQPHLTTTRVNVRTLDSIIQDEGVKTIDFLSIDTEGTELDVLKGFDINKYKPRLFVIENNFENPNIKDYLIDFGYDKTLRIGLNDFFVYHP